MSRSHTLLRIVRTTHLYVGIFIAPALLFFAFTGAIQTFSLHETTRGSSYTPPAILVRLAQLHKKQTLALPARKSSPPAAVEKPHGDAGPAPAGPPAGAKNLLPMKIFFLLVAIGLATSTVTGIYMTYRYMRRKVLVTLTLVAGVVVPALLTLV